MGLKFSPIFMKAYSVKTGIENLSFPICRGTMNCALSIYRPWARCIVPLQRIAHYGQTQSYTPISVISMKCRFLIEFGITSGLQAYSI